MPRRKQGHSKECATGAYLKKKIDPAIALIKHESLKHNKLNKDMVYKLKKTTSKSLSASDEKNAREHIKAFKSLNDDKVSHHEVNNNSLTLNQDQTDNEAPPNINCYSSPIVNGQNIPISSSISDGGSNTIPAALEPAAKTQINSYQISDNVSYSKLESNAGPRPQKVLDVVEKRTAGMSGVLAKVSDQERRNLVDTQPARYRISASINSSNASKEATESVLENNSHLPSSVYGTSASNIENVLTGLKVSESCQKQSTFLQDILGKKISNVVKNDTNCPGDREDRLIEPRVSTESLAFSTASNFSQNNDKNNSFSKLKLHMPDNLSNDDSNSSLASVDKNARFPKITSPQILEQHISKIISENAAIVETLDPMWSRRYFKQASQTIVQSDEGDGKKTNGQDDKSSLPNLLEIGCKSKLQSALLSNNQKCLPIRCTEVPSNSMCFTQAVTVPSVSIYSKVTCSATEEELKGTAIKSLLSLNKGSYTKSKKPFFLEKDNYHQHPQNPEGSIIKDLLLQSKSQEDSKMEYSSSDIHSDATESSDKDYLVYKCSQCSMTFSNKYNLEVHLSFCDAAKQLLSLRDSTGNARTFESNAQVRSFENPDNQYKVRRQTWSESSKREAAIEDGPILKKQLLMPKSPPMKRRKISDLVLTSFSTEPNTVNFTENKISNRLQLLNDMELPPAHRSRSHSVHLYGGEVQVLDGTNTRKIKIKTSLPGAFSVVSTKSSSDSQKSKNEAAMRKDSVSFPGGVVSISQPVHNSGAIVHFPTTSIPNIVPCVTLSSSSVSKYVKPLISFPKISFDSEDSLTFSVQNETTLQTQKFSFLNSCLPDMHHIKSPCKTFTTNTKTTLSTKTPVTTSNKPFYSSILSTTGQSSADFDNPFKDAFRNNRILPTVLFTPSSPTRTCADDTPVSSPTASESSKKFLAPTRPTSLPLKKNPFTMVSSTLVSPETPRPKKSCVQLYLNGHAYTYLGLKCSTRSTYCSIYRPQPMFVLQENNPKLSMYSNWQVVPAKEELSGLSPGQVIALYCSKHQKGSHGITVNATVGEPLILTHSSYWTYRSQDHIEEDEPLSEPIMEDNKDALSSSQSIQDALVGENSQSESIISSTESKAEKIAQSTDDSNLCLEEIENTLSDADLNNSNDEEDCQDDGTESLTDSSQPKPPKRVKICEGGFKSNEDYTYVRGRGRGKYVCEECGIRCKKPSMLKKHIRTHTDLRPYKCRHCSFAFKTKGNLTKHMKSKAHHKKCTELGIDPVPTTTDDSQVDEEALAKQVEQFNKRKSHFSDDDEGDDDDEDEDSDESDDDCESDASSMISNTQQSKMLSNGHSKKSDSQEQITFEVTEDNVRASDSISQHALEQEAVRSLLNLSSLGEQTQWSNSTGDLTDVTSSGETDTNSLNIRRDQLLISPTAFSPHTVCTGMAPSLKNNTNTSDQWLSTETLGHRPRSYSADIPFSGGKEAVAKLRLVRGINIEGSPLTSPQEETNEFGVKEQYTRRYSISVARERRPRALNPFDWGKATSTSEKWLEGGENADQPMDLSVTRDLSRCKAAYTIGMSGTLINMVPTDDNGADLPVTLEVFGDSYQLKTLPVLSPQILVDYETSCGVGSNTTEPSVLTMEEEPVVLKNTASTVATTRSSFYPQDASTSDANRKETETTEDPSSPDMADYSVNSPVSPSNLEDNAYYYPPEGATPTTSASAEDSSRSRAEFIVPTSSSSATNMEEGKCVCRICNKMFAKSSHLRLHVNIHYFERPFRCDNCAVSFRTKGHLQKHKRSVSHYNKVNMNMTFGTPTVDNPRPFKCGDCKIAFRIHGHLAKHLRSKMHIMKLECLGKLPFGMYAEMERSGISLNEIDTTDCNNSLESLQVMAQKLYQRDPRRMRWQGPEQPLDVPCTSSGTVGLIDSMLPIAEPLVANFDAALSAPIALPAMSSTMHPTSDGEDVKQELSEAETLCIAASIYPDAESAIAGYVIPQTSSGQSDAGQRVEVPDTDSSLHRSGTCHICGRLFKSAKFLQVHLYCDHPTWSSSSASESLVQSTFVSSATNSQELACDLCGKQFPNQKVLQQHLLSHAQPRPFVCELCDAGFTSSSSLEAHKATHQNNSSVDRSSQSK